MTDQVERFPSARADSDVEEAVTQSALDTMARDDLDVLEREGLEIESLTQWQLTRRKFFQHKLAVGSLILLLIIILSSLFAEQLAPYPFDAPNVPDRSLAPTLTDNHFFGTDKIGRDYFSRTLYGTRTSIYVAFFVSFLSTGIGVIVGGIAGYYGKWIDNLLMRVTDLFFTLPFLPVLMILANFWGRGNPIRVGIVLAFLFWTTLARIVRGEFLSLREKEYVEAAKALGASDARIIFRHILPNALGAIIVNATLTVATAILVEAALSFLGFGIQPPFPALGKLISDGQDALTTQWWLAVFPGLTIVAIALCINFIGDGLRDALDPKQRVK
ncbi:MAG: ABC transporter permease [Acidimicrobiia bacterium]|nr:ABC transporter permease [Acidimicrobiia bacterium]MDH4308225.1 ABC transporter permease [Acidimicrobiia bacterium]MDH5292991.1 ABC transporter permease [Acidimicrobiia bacterium]